MAPLGSGAKPQGRQPHSLVGICITPKPRDAQGEHLAVEVVGGEGRGECRRGRWVRGRCVAHGKRRMVYIPCKRRDCEVCGPAGRYRIAERVAYGLRELAPVLGRDRDGRYIRGAAWLVLTWGRDIPKSGTVRPLGRFVEWVRKRLGERLGGRVEYVCTWEHQQSGRWHLNLVMAPWAYIPQREISEAWQRFGGGKVVWVEWVRDEGAMGAEISKAKRKRIGTLAGYISKLEQSAREGRRVSFSRGWPKPEGCERKGAIEWRVLEEGDVELTAFLSERELGWWVEVAPGEWVDVAGGVCDCFEPLGHRWKR